MTSTYFFAVLGTLEVVQWQLSCLWLTLSTVKCFISFHVSAVLTVIFLSRILHPTPSLSVQHTIYAKLFTSRQPREIKAQWRLDGIVFLARSKQLRRWRCTIQVSKFSTQCMLLHGKVVGGIDNTSVSQFACFWDYSICHCRHRGSLW